ncbi:demethylmenaquinone methyltransferase / 2-methoxy-6-polyprenyl-1,4-benzoquinol methylase [Burkholderiales bacterium]|nr:demethylmenaquinone methyltransferase / 2-methoxy-6-polyprenyl-1,4-benzoquinol methylase [Burkholderiales bacterium]
MSSPAPDDPLAKLQAFWNSRYAGDEFVYGTEPNDFVVRSLARIAEGARVLCLADGEGRNSVWLARQGCRVTAVDVAAEGVAKARRLAHASGVEVETHVADVTRFDMGHDAWDAIVSIFLHLPAKARRALHRRAIEALAPGGVFVYEAYGPQQPRFGTGGPPEAHLLHPLGDVVADFDGCAIEHRHEGVRAVHEGRLHRGDGYVVQVIARKRG